jgi:predicted metallo-beta-lactamase superfamily hydrolase
VLVFIESELLGYLVLTVAKAAALKAALLEASRRAVERGEE